MPKNFDCGHTYFAKILFASQKHLHAIKPKYYFWDAFCCLTITWVRRNQNTKNGCSSADLYRMNGMSLCASTHEIFRCTACFIPKSGKKRRTGTILTIQSVALYIISNKHQHSNVESAKMKILPNSINKCYRIVASKCAICKHLNTRNDIMLYNYYCSIFSR